ncbi:MAG: replication initiation protein [Clostridia bacterium]|nr:replication initiation protein [Clostridia bacterium]
MKKAAEKTHQRFLDLPPTISEKEADKIEQERLAIVRKSNKLIRKFRAEMNTAQYKITLYLISKAYTLENDLKFTMTIQGFCKCCGLDYENGYYYRRIKQDILELANKGQWMELYGQPGKTRIMRLIYDAEINENSGTITLFLDEKIKPYILFLREQYENKGELYTQFALLYTLPMRSLYSIRLYELLKSWATEQSAEQGHFWTIEELQKILGSNYDRYPDFRRKVIEKAVPEINEYTDLTVEYEPIKQGRSYKYINFYIRTKSDREQLDTKINNSRKLDDMQITFDDLLQAQEQRAKLDEILRKAGAPLDDE